MKINTTSIVTDKTQKDFIKIRRFLSIFFSALLATFFCSATYAEQKDIAEISTCADLQAMSLTGDHILINDIDCDGFNFVPVGSMSTPFEGSLDGDGFRISNLVINVTSASEPEVGLFAVLRAAEITNLTIENIEVFGGTSYSVGTLAGTAMSNDDDTGGTHIRNVHVSGQVETIRGSYVGGLVGNFYASDFINSTINNSSANVNVNLATSYSTDYVGGLVADAWNVDIHDTYATGSVYGGGYTGGLIGSFGATSNASINRTYATGNVSHGNDGYALGGLLGQLSDNCTLTDSYATGQVSASPEGQTSHIGGLVGTFSSGRIYTSFAKGNVFSYSTSYYATAGGLVGIAAHGGSITNSYATGSVTAIGGNTGGLIGEDNGAVVLNAYSTGYVQSPYAPGGLIGGYNTGEVSNSYWDTITSNQSFSMGGEGKTTSQMYQQSTYINWDFNTIWSINNGSGYPYLSFETSLDEGIEAVSMK